MQVYGADKVWMQMNREGITGARCTVERLMRRLGLRGVIRGKVRRTRLPDTKAACPLDRVNRVFKADRSNQLWVSDFTYLATSQGWLYVAYVIDVYARQPERDGTLTHHSDRRSQYVSIRCCEQLAEGASNHRSAAPGMPMTTPWPRRSTDFTRPN